MRKLYLPIYFLLCAWLAGCQKETTYQTAEDKLADKDWYLEKKMIGQQFYLYTGVPTFSFKLTKTNRAYNDSDGIAGTYSVTEQPAAIELKINSSNRQVEAYQITLLEKEVAILQYTKNNILNTFYFSTRP